MTISYQVTAFGAPLERVQTSFSQPAGSEVLLRVDACGVCHSDVHIAEGSFDMGGGKRMDLGKGVRLPRTLGHEITGTVVAAGPDAAVEIGSRRLVYPWIGCGSCALCRDGEEQLCGRPRALGANADGGYSERVTVPHPRYLLDYGALPQTSAAILACAGLTAYGALRKAAPVGPNRPLLLVGAGGVGEAAIRLTRPLYGVAPVVADIDPAKREHALAAGASVALDPADDEARRALHKETDGGFAAAVDFVGAESTVLFATSMVRKGGRVVVVGLFGGALQLALPMLPLRSLSLLGSYVGSLDELRALLALVQGGAAPAVAVRRRPLAEAQAALDGLRAGHGVGRTVLIP